MKWEFSKIGDNCEVTSSKRIFYSEYVKSGIPFYRSKEVIQSFLGQSIDEHLYISEEKYKQIADKFGVPEAGDMLLTSVGTIGVPYLIKESDCFYFKDGNLTWFKNFSKNLSSKYLYYWIQSPQGKGVLFNSTIGSSQKALTISMLKGISIPLPPIGIQNRITDILSSYDDLIENNQKQIKLLEEAAMRLYKEWFVKLRFPGYETTKIVDGVPEGWELSTVKGMGQVITGKTPSTAIAENYGKDIPFVKIPDMHDVIYPLKTEVKLSERGANTQKNKLLPPKSIMVSCIATVGLVCIAHEACQTNQQINSIILNDEDHLYYMFFKMKGIKSLLEGVGSNGATMTNVNKTKFENIELLKPENEILKKFNNLVEPFFSNILALSKQNEKLKEARDKLLSKLMNGEIEV
jgi:type I restriction enzyme S subunit